MKVGKKIALGALGGLAGLLAYGVFVEPRFLLDVNETEVRIPNLPRSWEGKRIALIADIQVGMFFDNIRMVRRVIRTLIDARPEAVFFAGDFIYHPGGAAKGEVERAIGLMRPLVESGIPVYAVLGNHDYGMNTHGAHPDCRAANHLSDAMSKLGVHMLMNESARLPDPDDAHGDGSPLYVVGVGPKWLHLDDVQQALAHVPKDAARVVLMHNPESFAKLPAHTAPLAMSGHTHGGQMRLPNTPHWSYLALVRRREVHADGWYSDYGNPGNRVYVNRGVGFSAFPARINCRPEITFFTLRGGPSNVPVSRGTAPQHSATD